MDLSLMFGGSLMAAFIAGVIALFAPCCISVMLPAYFAGTYQNRKLLVAMTLIYAAGIATVILPITLGATFLVSLLNEQHTVIYTIGGLLLMLLAGNVLMGGEMHLPMPGNRKNAAPISIYSLGIFSGITSSCCAPVLAGVIALSGFASSFSTAFLLGISYVMGMVLPLMLISLLWSKFDWRTSRLFQSRRYRWKFFSLQREVTGTAVATGALLGIMGFISIWVGLTQEAMPGLTGWQAQLNLQFQRLNRTLVNAMQWVPNWLMVLLLIVTIILLIGRANQQLRHYGKSAEEKGCDQVEK